MLNYAKLRELQRKEASSAEISTLEPNFYEEIKKVLEEKKIKAMVGESLLVIKEYENIKKILVDIEEKRIEKIVFMAMKGKQSSESLSREESTFLAEVYEVIWKNKKRMNSFWTEKKENIKRIKILKDITAYKGSDGKIYGPYVGDQLVELPEEEAAILLKDNLAENV
ncbi:DNA replication complex GINS family protein [Candidatus Micrarchaeota archaeon]|nr:DNA replication complex GINS family protein [Candidatus Micrarchaeota archaeon]